MTVFGATGLGCVRGERTVFTGLDFRVADGGALVLTGANGTGKSSLLRLLAGLGRPAAGRLAWNGEDIDADRDAHRRRVQYVGHADAVKPVLTVFEQVRFWSALRCVGNDDNVARTRRALRAFGIDHLADVPGRYLSAGQKRRVNLARILTTPAPVWLLDEPRTALDADAVKRLDAAIAAHRLDGGLVVLALHGGGHPEGAEVLDLSPFAGGGDAPRC